ncbi:MAG: OmpH family outer membrane protein [Treponema sp.]|nr:OmpH family outer membrane protein [Treponema sp.]
MKKLNKLFACLIVLFTAGATAAFAQQITRFGVVDTSKVYSAYFRTSTAVRNYEKKRSEFQDEITRLTDELRSLQQKKLEFEKNENSAQALKVEAEITKKKDYLTEYTNAKNVELESMKKSLQTSDEFYKKLYKTLEKIAESGGYSMILSLQESNSILWYSNSVDITDQVISDLGL